MTARRARRAQESAASYTTLREGVDERALAQITRRIVRALHPAMIILFGSRAYGKPRAESDVDLLVVMDVADTPREREKKILDLFPAAPIKMDVHTRTPSELTHRLAMGDDFIQEIVGRGKRLYPGGKGNGFVKRVNQALQQGQEHPVDNTEVVQEWIAKAEGDFKAALALSRQRKLFNADNLCWACEQCVEKYLKAFLVRHRAKFERDHHLDKLHERCLEIDADFRLIGDVLDKVAPCVPKIRYPGHGVDEETARAAFEATKTIRKFIRAKLGLH